MTGFSAAWPTSTDYTEAVQAPSSFPLPELRALSPVLNLMGVPTAATGQMAVVFLASASDGTQHALRCFTSAPTDGRSRYLALESHLAGLGGRATVAGVRWIDDGIEVAGTRWPVVLMPWIGGSRLDTKVEDLVGDRTSLTSLADNLLAAVDDLQAHGVGHGDLQHGNVLVDDSLAVTLVDLDGVWVSSASLAAPAEIGHPNYQHPGRTDAAWGPNVDSFSALVVDVSLRALAADPSLSDLMGGENLVLVRPDFEDASRPAWARLRQSDDDYVRWGADRLQRLAQGPVEQTLVPLGTLMQADQVTVQAPAQQPQQQPHSQPTMPAAAEDAWWEQDIAPAAGAGTTAQTLGPPVRSDLPGRVTAPSHEPAVSLDSEGGVLLSGPVVAAGSGAAAGLLGCLAFAAIEGSVPATAQSAVFLVFVAGLVGAVVLGWNGLVGGRAGRAVQQGVLGFVLAAAASLLVLPIANVLVTGAIDDRRAEEAARLGVQPTDVDMVDVPVMELALSWMLLAALVGLVLGVRLSMRAALFGGLAGAAAGLIGGFFHAMAGAEVLENRLLVQPLNPTTLFATSVVTLLIASAVAAARQRGAVASLTVMEGRLAGAEVLLRKESTIGSGSGSSLVLDGSGVLATHVSLRVDGDAATVTALGEIQINGAPVGAAPGVGHTLRSGDVLRVGSSYVRFTSRAVG